MGRKSIGIVGQTTLRVSLVYWAVLLALSGAFTVYITTYMKNQILASRGAEVVLATDIMDSSLEAMVEPIISLGEYGPTGRMATGYYAKYTKEWMNGIRSLDAYLLNVSMFNRFVVDVNLLDQEMHTVYSMNDILRSDFEYGEQSWFLDALSQERVVKCAPPHGCAHLYTKNQGTTFSLIYPIRRQETFLGYILMEVSLGELTGFLKDPGEGFDHYLLGEEGQLIYASAGDSAEFSLPESALSSSGAPSSVGGCRLFQDPDFYLLERSLSFNGWRVVLSCRRQIILRPVRDLLFLVAVLGLVTLLAVLGILFYQVRLLSGPMKTLVERINTYDGTGPRSLAEYRGAPAEVAFLGERFEVMADKIHSLIQQVYVADVKKKEAELEALMNQINPHFLYNVFQLMETKAVLADNREIEDMIQALSQMMRYTMERKRDMVPIQEELSYIENYLMFYHERFPSLFRHEISCPEELLPCLMPKFILQPIVENCLKHGFDRREGDGLLAILVREEGEDLRIEVADNGQGMEEEALAALRGRLTAPQAAGGIGMVNTHERIRLLYGEGYGLSVESTKGAGTRVRLTIRKGGQGPCTRY